MTRVHGDEIGLYWDEPPEISLGRSASKFHVAAPRADYAPPKEFRGFRHLGRIGLDIETKDPDIKTKGPGPHRPDGRIVGVGIGYANDDALYYPTEHATTHRNVADPDKFYSQMREEAAEFKGEIVGANLQYDLGWLSFRHGIEFPHATVRDVQIAEPLLDENRFKYDLGTLGREWVGAGKKTTTLEDLYGKAYIENMDRVDPGHAAEYGEGDVMLAMDVYDKQLPQIEAEGLRDLFEMESQLPPLLMQMRRQGVRVDIAAAERALDFTKEKAKEAADKIRHLTGMTVDVWSAQSIARACDHLGIEYPRTKPNSKAPKGNPSFVKEFLEGHPSEFLRTIVDQRAYEKIGGTFIESYVLNGHVNGRLHCQFNQLKGDSSGTVSGRFSSSNPNLQNIPTRHPVLGPLCRSLFIPEDDHDWGAADWSQIEYRFLVHYASITPGVDGEKARRAYIENPNIDFHAMAAELTGLERKYAKNINFGVVYGMGVVKMAMSLGVSLDEARRILGMFHGNSPFLKDMLDACANRAKKNGVIKTILGRKRRFNVWEAKSRKPGGENMFFQSREALDEAVNRGLCYSGQRAFTHAALNSLLQGSAADLMKAAMVKAHKAGLFNKGFLLPHLTVHDELDVSIPRTKAGNEAFAELIHIMENTLPLKVPVIASNERGANWAEAK